MHFDCLWPLGPLSITLLASNYAVQKHIDAFFDTVQAHSRIFAYASTEDSSDGHGHEIVS